MMDLLSMEKKMEIMQYIYQTMELGTKVHTQTDTDRAMEQSTTMKVQWLTKER